MCEVKDLFWENKTKSPTPERATSMKGHQLVLKASEAAVLATEVNQFFLFISWDTVRVFQRGFSFSFFLLMKEYFEKPHLLVSERCRQPGSRGGYRSTEGSFPASTAP